MSVPRFDGQKRISHLVFSFQWLRYQALSWHDESFEKLLSGKYISKLRLTYWPWNIPATAFIREKPIRKKLNKKPRQSMNTLRKN